MMNLNETSSRDPKAEDLVPYLVASNDFVRVIIKELDRGNKPEYFMSAIELKVGEDWQLLLTGIPGAEFSTSFGQMNATSCSLWHPQPGETEINLDGQNDGWHARETITLRSGSPVLQRVQTYEFTKDWEGAIHPGFQLEVYPNIRYTYPVQSHEQQLAVLPAIRVPTDWALPFPFHVWHNEDWVGLYGLDKSVSAGTIEYLPVDKDGNARLRSYYPDTYASPESAKFAPDEKITLTEIIGGRCLAPGDEPLLEAERMAAKILLEQPQQPRELRTIADKIANYYHHCELWEPDAFGPGRGWFTNMWVRTQTGPAKKRGEASGFFDLGWGEGIAVEMWMGAVRYWKRSGKTELVTYVDTMTRSLDRFRRDSGDASPYYDRSDGERFGDFILFILEKPPGQRIWTHSLGHTGSQLCQLYQDFPDYPSPGTRQRWLEAALCMARFLAVQQKENGDLFDIFDEKDREANKKPHRIAARLVVCGLWARVAQITGDPAWIDRAMKLAKAVAPEIDRFEYYNQMIDTFPDPNLEAMDGEAAFYVLEGLVPLYAATHDPYILALCKKAAAFGIAWTYFYDLPHAYQGIARGGQVCRKDIPLLYPVGPAKGIGPLIELSALTGDRFYERMAAEMAAFISAWQLLDPGKPWEGGMVHALAQYNGKIWGPDLAGQVDTGVSTGNCLAAIELWMEHLAQTAIS